MNLDICKKCSKQLYLYHFPQLTEYMKELNGLSCFKSKYVTNHFKPTHHLQMIDLDEESKKVWKEILAILDLDYKQSIIMPITKMDKLKEIEPLLIKLCPSKYCEFYIEQYICFSNATKEI